MKTIISVFVLTYGNIYQQYVDKGEDSMTASLLASTQATMLLLLNIMSLSFLFSLFINIGEEVFGGMPKYKMALIGAVVIGGTALLIHKYLDWDNYYKARYFEMLDAGEFKAARTAAKLVPYATMLLFALSITIAIVCVE